MYMENSPSVLRKPQPLLLRQLLPALDCPTDGRLDQAALRRDRGAREAQLSVSHGSGGGPGRHRVSPSRLFVTSSLRPAMASPLSHAEGSQGGVHRVGIECEVEAADDVLGTLDSSEAF